MILLHVLPLQTPLPAAARAHPDEVSRARAFLRAAHLRLDGRLLPPYKPSELPYEVEELKGVSVLRVYRFPSGMVYFETDSGRLQGYSSGGAPPLPALNSDGSVGSLRITDADAARLAQRFYNAAGYDGEIAVDLITDRMGNNYQDLEVRYVQAYKGIPFSGFADQAVIDINRWTGRLDDLGAPFSPGLVSPPVSVAPGGTLDQARLAAVRIVQSWQRTPVEEVESLPLRLVLWYPTPGPTSRNTVNDRRIVALGPEHVAAYRANRAILAYRGKLHDGNGLLYDVVLDARTGRALDIFAGPPLVTSPLMGGSGLYLKLPPLVVPQVTRPWRVDTGKEGWGGWTKPAASTLVSVAQPAPAKGTKLALTDGKAAFPALCDPATGLVAISGKTYRPGPALAALLKRRAK